MYVGKMTYEFNMDEMDEIIDLWKHFVIPEASKLPGFIRAQLFVDRRTGKAFDIGFWASKEDAERFEDSGAYGLIVNGLKGHTKKRPSREKYELVAES